MSIRLVNVCKNFGNQLAVSDVCLDVPEGELFVLLGESGSGKTTILRLIAGLLRPDSGQVFLRGREVSQISPDKRNIGMVFQSYALFKHLDVRGNIEFGLKIRGVSRVDRRNRSDELLELMNLTGLDKRFPSELSGGQCQRVGLARALASKPDVLLLDEPFAALDVKIRSQLRGFLRTIQQQLKVTTLLVTHDQEEAFEVGDRVGIVERNRMRVVGAPAEIYDRPPDEFVAAFLGRANILVGWLDHDAIRLGPLLIDMPSSAPRHEEGAPVRLVCRPEQVVLATADRRVTSTHTNVGVGTVKEVIFGGAASRVFVELRGLRGARAVRPAPEYGSGAITLEALVPQPELCANNLRPGIEVRVAFSGFHVLEPSGIGTLAAVDQQGAARMMEGLGQLSRDTLGPTRALAVVSDGTAVPSAQKALELQASYFRDKGIVEFVVKAGVTSREVLLELQVRAYDVFLQPWDLEEGGVSLMRKVTLARDALRMGVSSLFARPESSFGKRIIVCTDGSEAGKSAVAFAGRLARRTKGEMLILHVQEDSRDSVEEQRIGRHLQQAVATLDALGVSCVTEVKQGQASHTILEIAQNWKADIVVLGTVAERSGVSWSRPEEILFRKKSVSAEVLRSGRTSVLFVPLREPSNP